MFERKRSSDPHAEALAEIDRWGEWFKNAHEERLRDFPDKHLIEQERAQVAALTVAITGRMKTHHHDGTQTAPEISRRVRSGQNLQLEDCATCHGVLWVCRAETSGKPGRTFTAVSWP